jgi:hypothetical protein
MRNRIRITQQGVFASVVYSRQETESFSYLIPAEFKIQSLQAA